MAATATATPQVAQEIAARLGLNGHRLSVRSGFDRPNLTFDVVSVEGKGAVARKRAALMHALTAGTSGEAAHATLPAIADRGTRKDTDEVAADIARAGTTTSPSTPVSAAGAPRQSGGVHARQRRGGRRDERVRHGRRQGGRAHGCALGAAD